MFYEIIDYFSNVMCESVAQKAVPILLYSGILQKFYKLEQQNSTRYRLNVLLTWEYGYFKSTLLEKVASWMPVAAHSLVSSSAAAIRGSFSDGKLYVPELLLSDIMMLGELTSVLKADEETIAALLVALEEANVRVALVKGAGMSQAEQERVRKYGAHMEDDRLCYRNKAAVWAATHTVDNIPELLRDAFLSRFYVAFIPSEEFPDYCAWRDPRGLYDIEREKQFSSWLENRWKLAREPDHDFAQDVLEVIHKRAPGKYNPRQVGDLRRIVLGHHCLVPDDSVGDAAAWCGRFLSTYSAKTTREQIAQYIYQHPRTLSEIITFTGGGKSNVLGHLKRMGAMHVGVSPVRYYIDAMEGNGQ